MNACLSAVGTSDLKAFVAALERGDLRPPLTTTALQAGGFGHLAESFQPYLALDPAALRAVVEAVLAERHHRRAPKLSLVWTGDDPGVSHSRHTRVVLAELFGKARKHVLVAGYSFDRSELFDPLYRAMSDHGVTADFFLDIQQLLDRLKQAARAAHMDWSVLSAPLQAANDPRDRGRAAVALFFQLLWPFGEPRPTVYFDPRTAQQQGSLVSLHAKCVVIDHEYTLITSANFTDRGQTRNLEAGVAIEDRAFAASLERQWSNLVDSGVVGK